MHLNYYFLKQLTRTLKNQLNNFSLATCYSQNKDELIFGFVYGQREFYIKAIFNGSFSIISFPKEAKRAKKNSINLFDELINKSIVDIYTFQNERSFCIELENGYSLVFKLHGNRSNIILFKNEKNIVQFRNNLIADKNLIKNDLNRIIDQSNGALINSSFDMQQIYPTFGKKITHYLEQIEFNEQNDPARTELINQLILKLNSGKIFFYTKVKTPYLTLLEENNELLFSTEDPIEACNYLASNYLYNFYLEKEKKVIIGIIQKIITKSNNYIKKSEDKLEALETTIKYEEMANIIMANLHIPLENRSSIELFDFYRNENIDIKLKKNLSLQKNAEIYYRKSKHQQIEKDNLRQNISSKEKTRAIAIKELSTVQNIINLKSLKKFNKTEKQSIQKNIQTSSPFNELNIDGFRVFIGKSAKNNDQLISKHCSKNDLWLHARGVSGSHVVIKENNNSKFPMDLIEKVASLAAWHSKGKNDSLCPVIYTPRKFIRKPKGALPGQVVVEKEEVILVKPCRNVQ
ncbi:MAG: putative ribosome quality control (RQC) complex YloA/Tae2 family protein [Saprospiraceae bacterium]|jgi:predicted ribosome quality control (RQC) complex YloA/Tae2 family protein